MTSVTAQSIGKSFGSHEVLRQVSFEVKRGELFFLLGPSGCGKTTLLRLIAGFETPDSGKITFEGKDVSGVPPERRGVGMVFQNYALWPHLTAGENVGFGLEVKGWQTDRRLAKIREVLDLVRCGDLADRFPGQLSGGQQQRIALARALAVEPELLLLDEPLSNLDAALRHELREEIRRLHERLRITTIYVTHDQSEALSLADRMLLLNRGEVVQEGSPRSLYWNPKSAFAASFLGLANIIPIDRVLGEVAETVLGRFNLRGSEPRDRPGGLSLRPEEIKVSRSGGQTEGRLIGVSFEGAFQFLRVEAGGLQLAATVPGNSDFAPEETVFLSFPQELPGVRT